MDKQPKPPVHIDVEPEKRRARYGALLASAAVLLGAIAYGSPATAFASGGQYNQYPTILTTEYKGTPVTMWGWDPVTFDNPMDAYIDAKSGVLVTARQLPVGTFVNQLVLAEQSGTLPDVFKIPVNTDIPQLVQVGAVKNITSLVAPYRKYLSNSGWAECTYNGQVYCLPANSPAGGIFYREDILKKYGINPTSLTTWSQFIAAAKQLSSASDGKYYLSDSANGELEGGVLTAVLNEAHAVLLGSNLQVEASPSSPQWQSALAVIRQLMEPGVGNLVDEFTPQWYTAMKTGSIAAYMEGTWFPETIIQQAPNTKGDWLFEPFPAITAGGDRYPTFGSASIAVSAKTDKVGAAFQVAKAWSIDPEGSVGIGLQQLGISVVSTAAFASSYLSQPNPYFANNQPYWKVATEAYTHITWQPPENTAVNQAGTILSTDITSFLRGQSADAFLNKLASDLRSQVRGAK